MGESIYKLLELRVRRAFSEQACSPASEQQLARRLQRLLPNATPMLTKADWHCAQCATDYHGERYCLICRTGHFSHPTTVAA